MNRHSCRGYCAAHYQQLRQGKALTPLNLRKGWYKASNGYIYIWDPEHPNADKRGYVAEHTKVMAEVLGRPLFQKRRCIIVTGRETTTGLRTSSCGLEAGSHPELE